MSLPCRVQCSQDVFEAFRPRLGDLKTESFVVALLNSKNDIIKKEVVGLGTSSECRVEPIQVFYFACKNAAQRIILIHNHPSGDTAPSPDDIALTRRLKSGAEILGIAILDHVVISKDGYSSMRDLGLL